MSELTTYVSAIGGGLGDIIVALPVISALIARGQTVLVMRTPRQLGFDELIPGLAGTIKEVDLSQKLAEGNCVYINLRAHRLQTDYFWGGPEFERDYPEFLINDILAEMCRDLNIAVELNKPCPMPASKRDDLSDTIVCVPGTTVDTKSWSTSNWLSLKSSIEKLGYDVVMLGQPEYSTVVKELSDSGFRRLETKALPDAVDILSSARAVVSVDTGLMHVAVQQNTPTICLFQDIIFHRPYTNAYPLVSKHCSPLCVANRMSSRPQEITEYPAWNWETCEFKACKLPEEERCINSITVDEVMECLGARVLVT